MHFTVENIIGSDLDADDSNSTHIDYNQSDYQFTCTLISGILMIIPGALQVQTSRILMIIAGALQRRRRKNWDFHSCLQTVARLPGKYKLYDKTNIQIERNKYTIIQTNKDKYKYNKKTNSKLW